MVLPGALEHSGRKVHDAYAKRALVIVPPLDEDELTVQRKVIVMPLRLTLSRPHRDKAPL